MKKIGLILATIIVCAEFSFAQKSYEVFSIDGTALEKVGTSWRIITKDDILSDNAIVKINGNTTIEFADQKYVYTINQPKQDSVKGLIAWIDKQTVFDKFIGAGRRERVQYIGAVTVRDAVSVENNSNLKVNDNEIYIIFYDSGRSLTAFVKSKSMSEFIKIKINTRDAILDLIDESRASGSGLELIYNDNRLYSMLWADVEPYLSDGMTIVFEVPQYLYPVEMDRIKMTETLRMGNKYSMNSVEPRL